MHKLLLLITAMALFTSCGKKEKSENDFSKPETEEPTTSTDPSS